MQPAGHVFRIVSIIEGPQVGDLNLWNAGNLAERFFSGKTRALHATHVSTGDRLWSALALSEADGDHHPQHPLRLVRLRQRRRRCARRDRYALRPLHDTRLLAGGDYHHCCHSNLTRALAERMKLPHREAEPHIHDVLNVFMVHRCYLRDTHRYFMKASPVRPGDAIEFFAEIDLIRSPVRLSGRRLRETHSSRRRALPSLEGRNLPPPATAPSKAGGRLSPAPMRRSEAAAVVHPCGGPSKLCSRWSSNRNHRACGGELAE